MERNELLQKSSPPLFPIKKMMRILIADAQEIEREGIRVMVERETDWEVCGVAENGPAAVARHGIET